MDQPVSEPEHLNSPPSLAPRDILARLSGREVLEGLLAGKLPPPSFGPTMNILPEEVGEGRVVFSGSPGAAFLNPQGTVHGGWISTILDSAMACAVHSTLKAGQLYTTTSMTVNFVRALNADSGVVRCEGIAIYTGGRFATSEGRLVDGSGRLIAHGTETCMVLSARGREGSA